jgi:hypothetical protein
MKKHFLTFSLIPTLLRFLSIINFLFFLNFILFPQKFVFSQNTISNIQIVKVDSIISSDSAELNSVKTIVLPLFQLIDRDTIAIGPNDELITDHYSAFGKPQVYDALHSFNYRRSDKFGGYINDKVNAGLERIRKKGYKSDVKKLYIQIDPLTLTVFWFAVVGPSQDRFSYVRIDSRGSAGGYLKAVEKQLPRMHGLYPDLVPVKFLEFEEDVIACYTWDGKSLDNYCSFVNIQQHFFKYRKRYDDEISLKYESKLDEIFGEPIEKETIKKDLKAPNDSLSNEEFYHTESKPIEKKEIKKKKTLTKNYRVKSGDTLSEIADKFNTTVIKIKKTNQLKNDQISIGQFLKIPN